MEAPPWRPEQGALIVETWLPGHRPALRIWNGRVWRYAEVTAAHRYGPKGQPTHVVYQATVPVADGVTSARCYRWPQPGLKVAHGPREPSTMARHIDSVNA